jgi:hypothetical protein
VDEWLVCVSVFPELSACPGDSTGDLRLRLMSMAPANAPIPRTPNATPTPIPAFAPVPRPDEEEESGAELADAPLEGPAAGVVAVGADDVEV